MALYLLYCRTRQAGKQSAFIRDREAGGHRVVIRNSARFSGAADVETKVGSLPVAGVYVTEEAMAVMPAYESLGIPCEVLSAGPKPIGNLPDLCPETPPVALAETGFPPDPGGDMPPGYHLEESGTWVKVIRNGERVSKAFRGAAGREAAVQAAWDHFMEVTSGGDNHGDR